MDRRNFVKTGILLTAGINFFPQESLKAKENSMDKIKNLDIKLVKDFVVSCHGDFDKVKELYKAEPYLIYSSYDWGNGNFENGVEAAGHMGNKEIADFLINKGARINFFTFCMLGNFDVVSSILKVFPEMVHAPGVHGFTALHHANQGGKDSIKVKELLISLGAKETKINLWDTTPISK